MFSKYRIYFIDIKILIYITIFLKKDNSSWKTEFYHFRLYKKRLGFRLSEVIPIIFWDKTQEKSVKGLFTWRDYVSKTRVSPNFDSIAKKVLLTKQLFTSVSKQPMIAQNMVKIFSETFETFSNEKLGLKLQFTIFQLTPHKIWSGKMFLPFFECNIPSRKKLWNFRKTFDKLVNIHANLSMEHR